MLPYVLAYTDYTHKNKQEQNKNKVAEALMQLQYNCHNYHGSMNVATLQFLG